MTDMIGIKNISVFLPGQEDTFFTGVVRMKLYTVSTGDTAYRYEKSIVVFFKGARKVLSTSVFNGGYHENYKAVFNHDGKVGSGMPCEMLADTYTEHMRILAKRIGLEPELVTGMGTAADMENVAIESLTYKELTVTAIVTGGIETNGGRVGDPADYYKPAEKPDKLGTINIILILDADMPPGTLARALVTCTEAKTAAIQELLAGSNYSTGLATGSGTDQTIIVANSDSELYFEGAGKHSKMGELIGKTVTKAVKAALSKQSGLNPKTQHNVFRRLKRFQVTTQSIWLLFQQQLAVLKPDFLEAAEKLDASKTSQLVDHKVCVVTMAPIVNKDVTAGGVKNLTKQQLTDIFTGKITNWKEVGGADESIVLITRPESSGTRATFKKYALGGATEASNKSMETDDSGVLLQNVKTTKGAIGYVALSYLTKDAGVDTVSLYGVAPTLENTYSGKYPVWTYEHMYTKGTPNETTQKFLDYIMSDEYGKKMESLGYGVSSKMQVKEH